jgi:hypothetical protein
MKRASVDRRNRCLTEREGLLVQASLPMLPAGSPVPWRWELVGQALAAWVLDDWQWEQALVCCPR